MILEVIKKLIFVEIYRLNKILIILSFLSIDRHWIKFGGGVNIAHLIIRWTRNYLNIFRILFHDNYLLLTSFPIQNLTSFSSILQINVLLGYLGYIRLIIILLLLLLDNITYYLGLPLTDFRGI